MNLKSREDGWMCVMFLCGGEIVKAEDCLRGDCGLDVADEKSKEVMKVCCYKQHKKQESYSKAQKSIEPSLTPLFKKQNLMPRTCKLEHYLCFSNISLHIL